MVSIEISEEKGFRRHDVWGGLDQMKDYKFQSPQKEAPIIVLTI